MYSLYHFTIHYVNVLLWQLKLSQILASPNLRIWLSIVSEASSKLSSKLLKFMSNPRYISDLKISQTSSKSWSLKHLKKVHQTDMISKSKLIFDEFMHLWGLCLHSTNAVLLPNSTETFEPNFSKSSLKVRTASAIFWNYLDIFRDYGLKNIFLGIKLFGFSR